MKFFQFTELNSFRYKGFAIAFCGGKTQLFGTLPSFSPQVLEYLNVIIVQERTHQQKTSRKRIT